MNASNITISALGLTGFSASAGKPFEFTLIRPGGTTDVGKTIPFICHSRPIYEILAGRADWMNTKAFIKSSRNDPAPKNASANPPTIAFIIPDPATPTFGFALRYPILGAVVPAIRLSAGVAGWNAEPLALFNENLQAAVAVNFCSPSVSALLDLTASGFNKLLINPSKARARLTYMREGGELFLPKLPEETKWTIACRWPDWQLRRLSFAARSYDLSLLEDVRGYGEANLRQLCSRMGLRIGDMTDS